MTPRLVLRCWHPADAAELKAAIESSLEHLRPWMPWADDEPTTLAEKRDLLRTFRARFDRGEDCIYGVFDRDERKVVGGAGLHPRVGERAREIGYWLRADHIGRGLATEIAGALTQIGFMHEKLARIEIHCDPRNERSAGVARRLGFTHEATLRRRLPLPDGTMRDTMVWTMIDEEFPSSPGAAIRIEAYDAADERLL